MAKLKLTSRRIPWSLLVKAAVFGAASLLPFWLFALIGLYLYLVPFFQPAKMALPFLAALALGGIFPPSASSAVIFGLIFLLTIGIRDLFFIDRPLAYEILASLLSFMAILWFFHRFSDGPLVLAIPATLGLSILAAFLARNFLKYAGGGVRGELFLITGLWAFLFWQLAVVLLLLPLNFWSQSAILFIFGVILSEMAFDYLNHSLTRRAWMAKIGIFLLVFLALCGISRWAL